jgi:DNA-directed RNA polymerase subunit RPC12/RpoP
MEPPLESELATAWAQDPERVDPDDYAPGAPYARQMTWAPCAPCTLQVHVPVAQFVYRGLACPRCGHQLLPPPADPEEWVRRILREEDELSEQL